MVVDASTDVETVLIEGTIVEPLIPAELWERANPRLSYTVEMSREVYEMEQRNRVWLSMWVDEQHEAHKRARAEEQRVWDSIDAQRIEFFSTTPEPTALLHSVFLRRFQKGTAQ